MFGAIYAKNPIDGYDSYRTVYIYYLYLTTQSVLLRVD